MKNTCTMATLLALLTAASCSDHNQTLDAGLDGGPGMPDRTPDSAPVTTLEVHAGKTTLRILTSPLTFTLLRDGQVLSATRGPVGLGKIKGYQASRFYDPANPTTAGVSWDTPVNAAGLTQAGAAYTLSFEGGATLKVSPVTGQEAVRLDLETAPADEKQATPQTAMIQLCMGMVDSEVFYGFGELFDTVSSRGVIRPMQLLVDGKSPSGHNENHAATPLAISPRGWSFLVDSYHAGAFDVGKTTTDRICAAFTTHKISAYLTTAADPLALVEAAVTLKKAPPALPPSWAFAPQQWRNALKHQDEILEDAKKMRQLDIPGSTLWIDNPWQTGYNTHLFDTKQFPDAKGTIKKLNALGYRVIVWSTPYVNADQKALWAEGDGKGYFVKNTFGKSWVYNWANGKGSLIDFSAPGATTWWRGILKRVVDLGIDGFKLDYGEESLVALGGGKNIIRFHGGKDTSTMHREFPGLYHEAYLDMFNKGEGFLITRAGALGEQKVNTCIWPGDLDNDFSKHTRTNVGGLPAAITGMLSLSAIGYPFYGSDIGGYRGGAPTAEVLMRWAEYAAFGTIMQLGGAGPNHNPWDTKLYGTAALPHYKAYSRMHMDLFPTIYSYAVRAAKTGRPVTRPFGMAFPTDKVAWTRDFQFMLGKHILVAPVITAGAKTHKVYLPKGKWLHFWSRKLHIGPGEVTVDAPLGKVPLFRKVGAIVALLGTQVDTLAPATDPTVVSYQKNNKKLRLELTPGAPAATTEALFDGTGIKLEGDASSVTVTLTKGKQFTDYVLVLDWKNFASAPKVPAKVSVDGADLLKAAKSSAVQSCPAGCWHFDAAEAYLRIRAVTAGKVVVQ